MRFIYYVTFLCLWTAAASAQPNAHARKLLRKGQAYRAARDYDKANRCLESAIREYPAYDEAYSVLGQWLYDTKDYRRAAGLFAAAARSCTKGKERFALPAGRSYLMAQLPDSAAYWLNQAPAASKDLQQLREQAGQAREWLRNRDTNQVRPLGPRINTAVPEFFPSLSPDGKTLYFTRRVNGRNEDFYYALEDSCGGWLSARNMGYPPNTAAQESAMTISADNHYLFFMRSDNRSDNGWGRGGCDLYLAYRVAADSPWSVPESFGATINTPAFEGMPSLSADINDLYFTSDRPGGYGGLDIWVSRFDQGLWQLPRNLGPSVNTPGNETAPFISQDNQILYFASDGHPGLGGNDLFRSGRINDSSFGPAINMGAPINSSFDEHSLFIARNGRKAIFASDRGNTAGNLDLYETELPESLAPAPTTFVLCYIYDSLSGQPVPYGSISLYDTVGKELALYYGNRGDGSVLLSLPLNNTFGYEVRGFGYQSRNAGFYYTDICSSYCRMNMPLLPQGYVKPVTDSNIFTIYYPKNVTEVPDSSAKALLQALDNWRGIPDIRLLVNSYTDDSGTPMINLQKSTIRAHTVSQLLINAGIPETQIEALGFGEVNPAVPNDSPEHQDQNRRAEIIVRY